MLVIPLICPTWRARPSRRGQPVRHPDEQASRSIALMFALQLVASNAMTTKKAPPAELVAAYLRAAIPDVGREVIDQAYAQLRSIGMPI